MTDITRVPGTGPRNAAPASAAGHAPAGRDRERLISCAELLFFAYRDFTGDADAMLEQYGFGRAHHRVLHFVHRNPGLRVAQLLEILRITKQSLARVLKQLVGEGFITQREGPTDRRERLLYVTAKGSRLTEKLTSLQVKRLEGALSQAGPGGNAATCRFLLALIGDEDRRQIETLARLEVLMPLAGPEEDAS